MGDVIEACEDGGFDIPATSPTQTPSRPAHRPPAVVDYAEVKPKRIIIQIEDDDDDDDDDDGGEKYVERGVLSDKTRATGVETLQRNNEDSRSSACAGLDVERKVDEKAGAATALSGPAYKIYKIETPGEDPLLEIVVSLSNEKTTEATPSSTAAASEKRPAAASALPTPDTVGHRGEAPSVSISIDGISVVVDPNPDANGGARDEGGGGGKGGSDLSGMCSLQLPYRVVPRTAMSFFHGDTLTVRAVVAAAG